MRMTFEVELYVIKKNEQSEFSAHFNSAINSFISIPNLSASCSSLDN